MTAYNFLAPEMKTEKFERLHHTELGQELWGFMQQDIVVRSLLVAVHLNKSPAAAISDLLLAAYGTANITQTPKSRIESGLTARYPNDSVNINRIKPYIGIMIKVILLTNGCELSTQNASANDPLKVFTNSARYTDSAFEQLRATAS